MARNSAIVRATDEHAVALARDIRPEIAAEGRASHGVEPLEGLRWALQVSAASWSLLYREEVLAIFGATSVGEDAQTGTVWAITGHAVDEHPLVFLRHSRQVIDSLLNSWPVLTNAIDARCAKALAWAKWLGFEVGDAVPYGVAGLPFHPIVIRRS